MGRMRRRRPLLRAAAVGGGAYVAGKRHAERQAESEQYAAPPPQAPPAPQAAPAPAPAAGGLSDQAIERLKELGQLHEQGVLTDEEFAAQKAKILG